MASLFPIGLLMAALSAVLWGRLRAGGVEVSRSERLVYLAAFLTGVALTIVGGIWALAIRVFS